MAKKEITYKGKSLEDVKKLNLTELALLFNARARRRLKRGFTEPQKKLLLKIKNVKEGKYKKPIKTHCRDMIILPDMVGMTIQVYTGKIFFPVNIQLEMLGSYLGEYALSRGKVQHSAPGIGATKSSAGAKKK